MLQLHCPECLSDSVKPIAIGKDPTSFAIVAMRKDNKPGASIHVNLIRCGNCGFTWIKLTDSTLNGLNKIQNLH